MLHQILNLLGNEWLRIDTLTHLLLPDFSHFAVETVHLNLQVVHVVLHPALLSQLLNALLVRATVKMVGGLPLVEAQLRGGIL